MYIASKLSDLRTLTIDVFKNVDIAHECKKLEKLNIHTVRRYGISGLNNLIFRLKDSLKCLTVEMFEFEITAVYDFDLFLDNLPDCKNLQELSLDASSFNGNDLLKAISKIPKLQKLELKNLGKLANEDMELLAQNCKELKYLKFDNCPSIHLENETILSFIEHFTQLNELSFHWAMVSKIPNKIWHKAMFKSMDVFITIGKKTFTIQKYLTMINSK